MIPLRDNVPRRRTPIVNWALIAVNLAVFGYEAMLGPQGQEALFARHALVPAGWVPWSIAGLASLVTAMFLHGGLFHVVSNLWTLWIFGDNVEDRMGPARYLAFYLSCGIIAGLLHVLTNYGSPIPTVGASGAIAGVLGAYLVLYPTAKVVTLIPLFFWPFFVELPAFLFLGFWFVSQLLSGTAALANEMSAGGVAWWAHVGGFLAGLGLYRWFLLRRAPATVYRRPPGSSRWEPWR
jgi:membrane associated rhomboid family serine protease